MPEFDLRESLFKALRNCAVSDNATRNAAIEFVSNALGIIAYRIEKNKISCLISRPTQTFKAPDKSLLQCDVGVRGTPNGRCRGTPSDHSGRCGDALATFVESKHIHHL